MGNIGFKPLDFREKYTIYYYDSLSLSNDINNNKI